MIWIPDNVKFGMAHIQVAGDTDGVVFGGLMNAPLQPTPTKKYQVKPFVCFTN
jgi:hypothetical protein